MLASVAEYFQVTKIHYRGDTKGELQYKYCMFFLNVTVNNFVVKLSLMCEIIGSKYQTKFFIIQV